MHATKLVRIALVPSLAAATMLLIPSLAAATAPSSQRSQAAALATQVAALDARLGVAVADYGEATQRLAALGRQIAAGRASLLVARYQLELATSALGDRAAAAYKDQATSLLDVVVNARSFEDLVSNLDLMQRLSQGDAQILASVQDRQHEVQASLLSLSAEEARARAAVADLATRKAAIERTLIGRRQVLRGVRLDIARLAAAAVPPAVVAPAVLSATTQSPGSLVPGGPWWPSIAAAARANGVWAEGLYRLMMAESGGSATAGNGTYSGLFQYSQGTWKGAWNPWASKSITDGDAQIKATAVAIRQGRGPAWWPTTYPWAFSRN